MPDVPQHAIRDGQYRIIYVTANGGLYKMFVDSNQVLMFKHAGAGNQGHMAGYAGFGGPPRGAFEFIMTTHGRVPNRNHPIGWHYVPKVGWREFGNGVAEPIVRWTTPGINPYNPDEWLFFGHQYNGLNIADFEIRHQSGPYYNIYYDGGGEYKTGYPEYYAELTPFWYTADAGETFTSFGPTVELMNEEPLENTRVYMVSPAWNDSVNGEWAAIGHARGGPDIAQYVKQPDTRLMFRGDRNGNIKMWYRTAVDPREDAPDGRYQYLDVTGVTWCWANNQIVMVTGFGFSGSGYVGLGYFNPPSGPTWVISENNPYLNSEGRIVGGFYGSQVPGSLQHRRGTNEIYLDLRNTLHSTGGGWDSVQGQIMWTPDYHDFLNPRYVGLQWFHNREIYGELMAVAQDAIYAGGYPGTQPTRRIPYGSTSAAEATIVPELSAMVGFGIDRYAIDAQHKTYILVTRGVGYGSDRWYVFDGNQWFDATDPAPVVSNIYGTAIINRGGPE